MPKKSNLVSLKEASNSNRAHSVKEVEPYSQPVWSDGEIIFQYLAIYYKENMPNGTKNPKVGSKFCQISNKPWLNYQKCAQERNFAKPGLTLFVHYLIEIWSTLEEGGFFKNMGQSRPLFRLFSSFSHHKSITNWKSVDGVLGIRTRDRRMVGADETTELWRQTFISDN